MFGIVVAHLPVRTSYNHTTRPFKSERADYSAITTWGIFEPVDGDGEAIILLDAVGRWDFPELKEIAQDLYTEFDPDMVLIERRPVVCRSPKNCGEWGCLSRPLPLREGRKFTDECLCAFFESGMQGPDMNFAEEVLKNVPISTVNMMTG